MEPRQLLIMLLSEVPMSMVVCNYMSVGKITAFDMIGLIENEDPAGDLFAKDFLRTCRDMLIRNTK